MTKTEFYWIQLGGVGSSIDDLRADCFNQGPDVVMNYRVVYHNDRTCLCTFVIPKDWYKFFFYS